MGREAECECECNGLRGRVKALKEPPDLILRGEIRRRLPLSQLEKVRAEGDALRFACGSEQYALTLGTAMAEKWAQALTAPPPSLATKLGITPETVARIIGKVDDDALRSALELAKATSDTDPGLILARVNTAAELTSALHTAAKQLAAGVPIWFIYPKGRGQALTENDVRTAALAKGIVDTKVCAISSTLTGLRFVRRQGSGSTRRVS